MPIKWYFNCIDHINSKYWGTTYFKYDLHDLTMYLTYCPLVILSENYIFTFKNSLFIFIYLNGKTTKGKQEEIFNCWFIFQMPTATRVGQAEAGS